MNSQEENPSQIIWLRQLETFPLYLFIRVERMTSNPFNKNFFPPPLSPCQNPLSLSLSLLAERKIHMRREEKFSIYLSFYCVRIHCWHFHVNFLLIQKCIKASWYAYLLDGKGLFLLIFLAIIQLYQIL